MSADAALLAALNGLAGHSAGADAAMQLVAGNHLFKGVVVMMAFWGLWFANARVGQNVREKLAAVLVVAIAAIFAGRGLALSLPYRPRPMHSGADDFRLPIGMPPGNLEGWSSMPSDHAVMYFALAAGLGLVSVWVGLLAALHAILVISLPRIYLGFHFPSDILVGALVGTAIGLLLTPPLSRWFVRHGTLGVVQRHPHVFYPIAFFITMMTASMFDMARNAGGEIARIVDLL